MFFRQQLLLWKTTFVLVLLYPYQAPPLYQLAPRIDVEFGRNSIDLSQEDLGPYSTLIWFEGKTVWQQFFQPKEADPISLPRLRRRSRHTQAVEIRTGKLGHDLAADATGHARLILCTSHRQAPDLSGAFADCLENGGPLGTVCRTIGSVFNVASGEDLAICGFHSSTNRKIRIGNIGVVAGSAGRAIKS